MTTNGGQDPRRQGPGPATPQADDGGLTLGLHRQTADIGNPGTATHDRMHGIGPSRRAVDGFQRQRYVDQRAANCAGLLQNGNCAGDPYWMPPDGNWWNYPGIGGSASNRSQGTIMALNPTNPGYDFAGGQTTSNTALATWAVPVRTAYAVVSDTELEAVHRRSITGFGHGTGGPGDGHYNCYSNCNCNCACACDCNCNCDCVGTCCFPAGTPVTLADGRQVAIETLTPGDRLRGAFGITNTVDDMFIGPIAEAPAYLINGEYFLAGPHRVWEVSRGWIAPDPASWYAAMKAPDARARFAIVHGVDVPPADGIHAPESERPKQMRLGDRLAWGDLTATVEITSIERLHHDGSLILYEPICHNGSGSYEVYGGMWAVGAPDYAFPFQDYVRKEPYRDPRHAA